MPDAKFVIQKRLAGYFLGKLKKAEEQFTAGLLDPDWYALMDWNQIKPLYEEWVYPNRETDPAAISLSNEYPNGSPNLLAAIQPPYERIKWLETAIAAAQRLKDVPAEKTHRGNLALTYRNAGWIQKSIDEFQTLSGLLDGADDVEKANLLCWLGECYRTVIRYPEAIECFNDSLKIGAAQVFILKSAVHHNLGITYKNQGKLDLSLVEHKLEREIAEQEKDNGGCVRANISLGMVYQEQLEFDEALEAYQAAARLSQQASLANSPSAFVYKLDESARTLRLAYGTYSKNWVKFYQLPIYLNQGIAEIMLGLLDEADASLDQALKIAQDIGQRRFEAIIWNRKGNISHARGNYKEAIQYQNLSLEIAREVSVNRAQRYALESLGRAYLNQSYLDSNPEYGFLEGLIQIFEESEQTPKDHQEWGINLVEVFLQVKQPEKALKVLQRIKEIDNIENKYRVAALLGLVLLKCGASHEEIKTVLNTALKLIDQVLTKTPNLYAAKYCKGLVLSEAAFLNDPAEAQSILLAQAYAAYQEALNICGESGVVCDARRLFSALYAEDRQGILGKVWNLLQPQQDPSPGK